MHCLRLASYLSPPARAVSYCLDQFVKPQSGGGRSKDRVPCCGLRPRGLSLCEGGPLGGLRLLWFRWVASGLLRTAFLSLAAWGDQRPLVHNWRGLGGGGVVMESFVLP